MTHNRIALAPESLECRANRIIQGPKIPNARCTLLRPLAGMGMGTHLHLRSNKSFFVFNSLHCRKRSMAVPSLPSIVLVQSQRFV